MNMNSAFSNPRCVADALGLGSLSDGEPGMDPDLLRQLYHHARGEDGHRVLFEQNSTFATGWVNLDSNRACQLVSAFVPLDDAENLKEARRNAQANLEAQAWNDVLGIESPPIICKVKIHGAKWGLRFQSAEPAMRGREILNENLPPISEDGPCVSPSSGDATTTPAASENQSEPGDGGDEEDIIENVLRQAGLPT